MGAPAVPVAWLVASAMALAGLVAGVAAIDKIFLCVSRTTVTVEPSGEVTSLVEVAGQAVEAAVLTALMLLMLMAKVPKGSNSHVLGLNSLTTGLSYQKNFTGR